MRKLRTLLWLIGATSLGWLSAYFNILPQIFPPLLFGLALNFSNTDYMKYRLSELLIPIAFVLIFLVGTVPFFMLGELIFHNKFAVIFFGCIGSFLLVNVTLRILLREIYIGPYQLLLIVLFSFGAVYIHALVTGQSIENYDRGLMERFDLTILIYQLFMTISILTTMTKTSVNNGTKAN